MRPWMMCIGLVMLMDASVSFAKVQPLRYVDVKQLPKQAVIVDTRSASLCQQHSLAGAHCIPSGDLLGPNGQLPSFADIFWALGTAGLSGKEHVLVVGDNPVARDFVAGVLYLCGQASVMILDTTVQQAIQAGRLAAGNGLPRAILRQKIYRGQMRDSKLILPSELNSIQQRKSVLTLAYAHRLIVSVTAMSNLIHHLQKRNKRTGHYVILGASVREAIAAFTRIRALAGVSAAGLRVVPIAIRPGMTNAVRVPDKTTDGINTSNQKITCEEAKGGVDVYDIQPRKLTRFAALAAC